MPWSSLLAPFGEHHLLILIAGDSLRLVKVLELHPTQEGVRYTIRGIFRSGSQALARADQVGAAGMHVLRYEEVSPHGNRLFFVAARHDVVPATRAGLPQRHSVDWEATRLALELFRQITRAARRNRGPVRWYKGLDVENLHACMHAALRLEGHQA